MISCQVCCLSYMCARCHVSGIFKPLRAHYDREIQRCVVRTSETCFLDLQLPALIYLSTFCVFLCISLALPA